MLYVSHVSTRTSYVTNVDSGTQLINELICILTFRHLKKELYGTVIILIIIMGF